MNELYLELGSTRLAAGAIYGGEAPRRVRERASAAALASMLLDREVTIGHDPDGAPLVEGDTVNISITHSARLVAVAVDPLHRIGIDIEDVRAAQLRRVAARVLSPAELDTYGADDTLLTRAWTLKEALYKAAGVPGADWRTDLRLPGSPDGLTARACGRDYAIIYAGEVGHALLSVVRAL